jgi:hypothetical protein
MKRVFRSPSSKSNSSTRRPALGHRVLQCFNVRECRCNGILLSCFPALALRHYDEPGGSFSKHIDWTIVERSPSLLASETLIEERQDLGDVELDVFKVEILLVVLLHFEEIVEFKIKLQ